MAKSNPQKKRGPSGRVDIDSGLLKRKILGRYELKKKLGAGGMGAVYLALDQELNRLVALKILPPEKAENPTLVKRFKAEAQAVAQLTHDNIVRVYESGEVDAYQYIALEYVEGTDVHRLIKKRGRLPVKRATEIITQVTAALEHAYGAGIVHRDIKPANLLITQQGVVKLTDLGLARVLDENEETSITRAGTTVGTVDYMAPEQARSSKAADIRSDIYSLGCTWYHMLTGSPPYPEGSVTNKLHAHAAARFPDPRDENESIPGAIVAVIQRMMSKKPEDRHQTPTELLEDLRAVKSTKKEISAGDLAALAGEVEEPQVSSGNNRQSAGLDDSDELQSSSGSGGSNRAEAKSAKKSGKSSSQSGSEVIPPREKRKLSDVEVDEKKGFNAEPFVYAGLVLGVIALVGFGGYLLSGVGGAMAPSDGQQVDLLDVAKQNENERGDQNTAVDGSGQQVEQAAIRVQPGTESTRPGTEMAVNQRNVSVPATTVSRDAEGPAETRPVIEVVDRSVATSETQVHSIADAASKTLAKEFVIELRTSGVYRWKEPLILDGQSVEIRAGKDSPGTILVDSAGALADGLITVRKGQLGLRGLHFGLLGYDLPGEKELQLLRVIDGDLEATGCSFTQEETRSGNVVLCNFQQAATSGGQLQWTGCLVRGSFWKPFVLSAQKMKFLMDGCLVCVGETPIFTVSHQRSANSAAAGDISDREIAITDSLLVSSGTPLVMNNRSRNMNVPSTQFRLNGANFVAAGSPGAKPFLSIENWPENVLSTAGKGKLSLLNWIAEASAFGGWKTRVSAKTGNTKTSLNASDEASWQAFWGSADMAERWQSNPLQALSAAQLGQASPKSLQEWNLTAAARPEADTLNRLQQLQGPQFAAVTWRAETERNRGSLIADPEDRFVAAVPRIKVDANKQDVGEVLMAQDLPTTAVVEVSGFGLRTCSPIQIQNRHVRIEFTSTRGRPPLTFRPIGVADEKTQSGSAWFQVSNGTLQLDGGVFRLDPPGDAAPPNYWVRSDNSTVVLSHCYVTAPEDKVKPVAALVKLTGNTKQALPARIENCYLQYGGTVCEADLKSQTVEVQGSVLVSQNALLSLQHAGGDDAISGQFAISHSTLSSRQGMIHFDVAEPGENGKPFVSGFVRECVFVQPVEQAGSKTAPQLISSSSEIKQLPRRVWWWGERNGFSAQVSDVFAGAAVTEVWPDFWGLGHVSNPLFGAEGVVLDAARLKHADLRPSSFVLYPECQAMQWGDNETMLGADAARLDLSQYDQGEPAKPGTVPRKGTPSF